MKVESPKFNLEILKRFLHISNKKIRRLNIEVTNKCNLNCEMCPRDYYKLPEENMEFSDFKKIIDKMGDLELVLPIGWGESFLHPDIDKMIDYLREKKYDIKITTNGLLLNNKKLIDSALKVDYLSFSLDEIRGKNHGNSKKVIRNIRRIILERNKLGLKKPYIALQAVMYKGNKDILKIIEIGAKLKVDRINLLRAFTQFDNSLGMSWEERKRIYKNTERLGKKLGVRVDMLEYASFSGLKRFLWKNFKWMFRLNKWCPRLYDYVYVTIDGKVTPCCALPRMIVGDLNKESLDEIWRGKKMNEFRRNHEKICRNCTAAKIKV